MPCTSAPEPHREKSLGGRLPFNACVSRPVSKKEWEADPEAKKAEQKEWDNLRKRGVWSIDVVRDWSEVARTARETGHTVHLARIFGIRVEKGSELPKGSPQRKYKFRIVYQGNNVVNQNYEAAMFQDLGSSPSTMDAGKAADLYGSLQDHDIQQADAEQAYVQADLTGTECWICLPQEQWDPEWTKDGTIKRPVVRLVKALYGHLSLIHISEPTRPY